MVRKKITKILLILSIAIFLFGLGFRFSEYKNRISGVDRLNTAILNDSNQPTIDKKNLDFALFWEVWNELEKKFIDKSKIETQKMFYGAIKGMVSSLEDPYTFFLTPEENKEAKNDLAGKFEGIGAQLGLQDNRIVIVAPLKNSPAQKANVHAGDYINQVE